MKLKKTGCHINNFKLILTVISGNILEYYDFLLFAHIGSFITPHFFPSDSDRLSHIISLILFGIAFLMRPIGSWFFGNMGDKLGRKVALSKSIFLSILPTLGIAILPTYTTIGIAAPLLLICLRFLQGISLGGEYTMGGTFLMEHYKKRKNLLSSIFSASGTIGSLVGLLMAYLCLTPFAPSWMWRFAFLLGAIASAVSYSMRKNLLETPVFETLLHVSNKASQKEPGIFYKRSWVIIIGAIVSVTCWIPMTYSNFYLTKILNASVQNGLFATFLALIFYTIMLPIFGWIADKIGASLEILLSNLITIPLSLVGMYLIAHSHIILGQFCLAFIASSIGATTHAVINSLFKPSHRCVNVGLYFTLGLSVGGFIPSIVGSLPEFSWLYVIPALCISFLAGINILMLSSYTRLSILS